MKYNRTQISKVPVDFTGYKLVDTEVIFKQYDVNTSILQLQILYDGQPFVLQKGEKLYMAIRTEKSGVTISKYQFNIPNEEEEEIINLRDIKRVKNNVFNIYLTQDALNLSGECYCELILADNEEQSRLTSQPFTIRIQESLTPNIKGLNFEKYFRKE